MEDDHTKTPTLVVYGEGGEPIAVELEYYGGSGSESYYKGKRPSGGTIEVHFLRESHFEDHPGHGEE